MAIDDQFKEDSFDLILNTLRNIVESIDDLDELWDKGQLIGSMFDEQQGLLEARINDRKKHDKQQSKNNRKNKRAVLADQA
jgi:hypothetical protein